MESNESKNPTSSLTELNDGVAIVLARMETHPEEFFTTSTDKWKFIYQEYFRDAMTETEKGMVFDKLKQIRRTELTMRVMMVMTDGMKESESLAINKHKKLFPEPAVLAGGGRVTY
jgi:vacuolar-type H+-ATPase catalytic subunit A/Vma1